MLRFTEGNRRKPLDRGNVAFLGAAREPGLFSGRKILLNYREPCGIKARVVASIKRNTNEKVPVDPEERGGTGYNVIVVTDPIARSISN